MRIICALSFLLCILYGCRQPVDRGRALASQETPADSLPLPELIALDPGVRSVVADWQSFQVLEQRVEALYGITGPEELEITLEELAEDFKTLEGSQYPEAFDLPSVRSREKVMKTFFLKTQAALYYRRDYRPALRQFLGAFNGLREQLNRIESNTFDPTLFQDE